MAQAQEFLKAKEQVRVVVILKGRQRMRPEQAVDFLTTLFNAYLAEYGRCVRQPSVKNLSIMVMPQ